MITWMPEEQQERFLKTSFFRQLWLGFHENEFEKEFDAYVLGDNRVKAWFNEKKRIFGYVCRDCGLLLIDFKESARPYKRTFP